MKDDMFKALKGLLSWCEDNLGDESWLDTEDYTDGPDGTWKSYSSLPELEFAYEVLQREQLEQSLRSKDETDN